MPPTPTPVVARRYGRFRGHEGHAVEEPVIAEMRLRIEVDGEMVDAFVAMLGRSAESRSAPDDIEEPTTGWSGDMAANARELLRAHAQASSQAEAA